MSVRTALPSTLREACDGPSGHLSQRVGVDDHHRVAADGPDRLHAQPRLERAGEQTAALVQGEPDDAAFIRGVQHVLDVGQGLAAEDADDRQAAEFRAADEDDAVRGSGCVRCGHCLTHLRRCRVCHRLSLPSQWLSSQWLPSRRCHVQRRQLTVDRSCLAQNRCRHGLRRDGRLPAEGVAMMPPARRRRCTSAKPTTRASRTRMMRPMMSRVTDTSEAGDGHYRRPGPAASGGTVHAAGRLPWPGISSGCRLTRTPARAPARCITGGRLGALSSAEEHSVYTRAVAGSNPVAPTM